MDLIAQRHRIISGSRRLITVSGNQVAANGAIDAPIKSLIVYARAAQQGSGDPSPSNVRNFTGMTSITATVQSGNQTRTATCPISDDGNSVYGGTFDMITGEATVTHVILYLGSNASPSSIERSGSAIRCWIGNSSVAFYDGRSELRANILKFNGTYATAAPGTAGVSSSYPNSFWCWLPFGSGGVTEATAAGIKNYLESHPIRIVAPLVTPRPATITPTTLNTFSGNNTISADAGDITVSYFGN